jgi:conjugation system TraG family ATPase
VIIVGVLLVALMLTLKDEGAQGVNIEKLLPIWKIEDDCILSKQGDITVAFRVELPEIFTLSQDDFEALHVAWIKAIKVLPKHTVFHKQDWFQKEKFKGYSAEEEKDFLSHSSDRFFYERPFVSHHCYLMLTKKPEQRKPASSVFSNLLRPRMSPVDTTDPQLFNSFMNHVGQFEKILADSGYVKLKRLRGAELSGTEDKPGLIERYCFLLNEGQAPLLQDIEFKPDWKIGNNHLQLYTLADCEHLPALCGPRITYDRLSSQSTKFSTGYVAPLGQLLPVNHVYNQFIEIGDAAKTLKRLESKRRRLQSLSAYSRENAIARDYTNAFLNEAISQGRLPVKGHFNIMAWSDDREELKNIRNLVSAGLAQIDATPHEETKGAPQLFWAALPGNEGELPENECFDSFAEQATCFLHMEGNSETSLTTEGIRLGDRLTGRPLAVDLFDAPMGKHITNRSLMLIGPSGSGKSFFTNHLLRSLYAQGAHILVVDVGHSYHGLCSLVDGYYFTYKEDDPIRFNPFYLQPGDYMDTEKRESIKTLLLALWKKDTETFKRSEYVALSNALTLYYEHLDKNTEIFPCFDSFYEFLTTEFTHVLQKDRVKEKDFDIDNFLYVLRPFFRGGEFDYLLNAKENLDLLQQRMIVFELDNVKDHPVLFPVITLVIMETFISKMRKIKGVKKMILIEEAWKALMRDGFAEYIKYLYKTVRKFYGIAAVVTQDIEDIISSPIVKQAIVNNADIKILLDQSKYQNKFSFIQELLGITDKGKMMILSINKDKEQGRIYKDVYIDLGGSWMRVYRVEVSMEEYYTYTTEEKEKLLVQRYAKMYGSFAKGIRMLVRDLKEKQVSS